MQPHVVAWLVAGIFTMLTVFYSVREVIKHLSNYNIPALQRSTVGRLDGTILCLCLCLAISCDLLTLTLFEHRSECSSCRQSTP